MPTRPRRWCASRRCARPWPRVRRAAASEARRLEPGLAPSLRPALEIPDDHAIDPRELTRALAAALRARRRRAPDRGRGRAGLRSPAARVDAACGSADGGGDRAPGRSWSPPGRGRRSSGVPAARGSRSARSRARSSGCATPAVLGLLTRVLRMQPGYLVPRGDGRYVLGATSRSAGSTRPSPPGACSSCCATRSSCCPAWASW